jgi:flagellar hook-basal body complex protein FliE
MSIPVGWAAQRLQQYTQAVAGSMGGATGLPGAQGAGEGPSFGDTLKQVIGGVSDAQDVAHGNIEAFLRGDPIELHQVMASQEEAGIALQMLVEVRNKFTEAYRSVINMQS